jgi:ligand-binding sensor domain-containing protein
MKHRFTILFFFIYVVSSPFAQYPYTSKIANPDPLPTPVIYDMLGDSKGYLWLATDKGLIKFNSRTFQILPFNSTLLKSVGYLNEDEQGTIWCANFYKQLFYVEQDSLKLFEVKDEVYKKLSNILNISITKTSIVVSSFSIVLEIDKRTHQIIHQIESNKNGISAWQYSTQLNNKIYCFSSKNQLYNFPKNTVIATSNNPFIESRLATDNKKIVGIERGKRDRQAFLFDGTSIQQLPNFEIPATTYIYHLAVTGEDEFWICTQNGAYKWDYKTGNTDLVFPNERVSDAVKDFQGNYWISTLDNGLFKCPNLNCVKLSSAFVVNNDNATKILKIPNSHFLVGNTKGEVVEIDNAGTRIKKFQSATNDEVEFIFFDEKRNRVFSDAGLFDYHSGKIVSAFDFGKSNALDAFGNVVIASFNRCVVAADGFNAIDTNTVPSNCLLYKSLSSTPLSIQGRVIKKAKIVRKKRTNCVAANQNKKGFWVGYDDNLYYYEYDGKIKIIQSENGKSIIATSLFQNKKNELLVCTPTNGLLVLDTNNNIQKHFTTNNGLQSNNAKKTIIDNNKIWLLTDESLEIIDLETNLVQDFFSSTGLGSLTVYDFAIDGNNILLATPSGVMRYAQSENSLGERIKITQLIVENNGKEISANTILPYNLNSINIKLDAIHYKAPAKLFFHYRLLGSDSVWHTVAASNNIINYNFLPAGNYTFEVYAADINMIFRSTTSSFPFSIAKPFWQKWWFGLLIGIGILGISYWAIKLWAKQFKIKQQAKENLLQSKLTAIRSQMNPHFLYNVLNTIQGLVYANKKSEATEMLGNFSDLMRKTLQESDKTEIILKDEIDSLKLYLELEKKRFDKDFEFTIAIDESIDITDVHIPSMFIQPFAENAIKHGLLHKDGMKNLNISILQQEHKLLVSIDDNGVGRKQAAIINQNKKIQSTGFAIKGIEDRMAIYNAMNKEKIEMEIVDKEQGTLVKLILPTK